MANIYPRTKLTEIFSLAAEIRAIFLYAVLAIPIRLLIFWSDLHVRLPLPYCRGNRSICSSVSPFTVMLQVGLVAFFEYTITKDFAWWFQLAAAAILNFIKSGILCQRHPYTMNLCTKFGANRSRNGWYTHVYIFSRWRPSAILDLFVSILDHSRRTPRWSRSFLLMA